MFVRVQVPPRVLKKIVTGFIIACYGFFITHLATYWQQNPKNSVIKLRFIPPGSFKNQFSFWGDVSGKWCIIIQLLMTHC